MKDELATYKVEVIALSKDTVEASAAHMRRGGISMPLLADPELEVIRRYGVEHHRALEASTGKFSVAGVHLAMVPSIKTMAIPTSLLIDEDGVIRWIDQTDDYRLRSSNERVLQAVRATFGDPAGARVGP